MWFTHYNFVFYIIILQEENALVNYEYDSIVRDLAQYLQWNDSIGSLFIVRGGGKGETTIPFPPSFDEHL